MMSTSLAAVLVSGLMMANTATQPAWQTDYRTAIAQAAERRQPLAVFIAHGEAGFARVVSEGALGTDAAALLKQKYVCLYVNTDTMSGKTLADSFQLKEGLVISDKSGATQALRHQGTVPQTELTGYLTKFADTNQVAVTQSNVAPVVQYAAPVTSYYAPAPVYYPSGYGYQQPQPGPIRQIVGGTFNAIGNTLGSFGGALRGG